MEFEWDPTKAASNLAKHGVRFADAVAVLSDDQAVTVRDERFVEPRFVTLGRSVTGRLLVVVHTPRGNAIRIISARKANAREARQYRERP
jgi:uncharacterized DUF497 family protein